MDLAMLGDAVIYAGAVAAAVAAIGTLSWMVIRYVGAPAAALWLTRQLEPIQRSAAETAQTARRTAESVDRATELAADARRVAREARGVAVEALAIVRAYR